MDELFNTTLNAVEGARLTPAKERLAHAMSDRTKWFQTFECSESEKSAADEEPLKWLNAANSALLESKLILGIRLHKDNPAKLIKFVSKIQKEGGPSLLIVFLFRSVTS